MAREVWGADSAISMPEPPDRPVLLDMGGFGMTTGGLVHHISPADLEEMFTPFFSPEGRADIARGVDGSERS